MGNISITFLLVLIIAVTSIECRKNKEDRKRREHGASEAIQEISRNTESKKRRKGKRKKLAAQQITPQDKISPLVTTFTNIFQPPSTDYRQTQCKEIPPQFALCYDIGYQRMHLPNLQGHDTVDELLKQSKEWTPLLATRCHPEARKFLCSVFAPVCVEDFSAPIPPCRSLCEAVRDGCSPTMADFNYPWPRMLECSQFPDDNSLCIPLTTVNWPSTASTTSPEPTKTCPPCRQKKISSSIRKKICSFDLVMKSRVKRVSYQSGNTKITLEKKSRVVYKLLNQIEPKASGLKLVKKNTIWMNDGLNCTCDVLDGVKTPYLITGMKSGNKFMLHTITRWRKSDRRLVKQMRKKNCKFNKNKRSGTM